MNRGERWPRILVLAGLVAMIAGALDPLEGSVVILAGSILAAVGVALGKGRHRRLVYKALALIAVGVGAMWWLSALGGLGGDTGRSMWWALVLLPYPIGWILGLVGAVLSLRGPRGPATPSPAE